MHTAIEPLDQLAVQKQYHTLLHRTLRIVPLILSSYWSSCVPPKKQINSTNTVHQHMNQAAIQQQENNTPAITPPVFSWLCTLLNNDINIALRSLEEAQAFISQIYMFTTFFKEVSTNELISKIHILKKSNLQNLIQEGSCLGSHIEAFQREVNYEQCKALSKINEHLICLTLLEMKNLSLSEEVSSYARYDEPERKLIKLLSEDLNSYCSKLFSPLCDKLITLCHGFFDFVGLTGILYNLSCLFDCMGYPANVLLGSPIPLRQCNHCQPAVEKLQCLKNSLQATLMQCYTAILQVGPTLKTPQDMRSFFGKTAQFIQDECSKKFEDIQSVLNLLQKCPCQLSQKEKNVVDFDFSIRNKYAGTPLSSGSSQIHSWPSNLPSPIGNESNTASDRPSPFSLGKAHTLGKKYFQLQNASLVAVSPTTIY